MFAAVVMTFGSPTVVQAGPNEDLNAAFQRDDWAAMVAAVDHGADSNLRLRGMPILMLAVVAGQLELVRALTDHGANVNAPYSSNGIWVLSIDMAAGSGSVEIIQILLDHGATVDSRDSQGDTPLDFAATSDQPMTAAFLLAKGADLKAVNVLGRTPLHYAAENGAKEAADVLVAHGADRSVRDAKGKTPYDIATESLYLSAEKKAAILPLLRPMAANSDGNESQSLEHELLQCLTTIRQTDIIGSQEISSGLLSIEISPSDSDRSKIIFSVRGKDHRSILDMIPQCASPRSCYGSISGMNYNLAQVGDKDNGYFVRIDREAAQYSAGEWRSNRRGRTTLVLSEHGSCNATSAKAKF